MLVAVDFARVLLAAAIYGFMENRLFFEASKVNTVLGRFKRYHLFMFLLFCIVGYTSNVFQWAMHIFLAPLIVDFMWFEYGDRERRQEDWSNIGGYPLIKGYFLWYYLVAALCIVLGALAVLAG